MSACDGGDRDGSSDLDEYNPAQVEFLSGFALGGGALEHFHFDSVQQGADAAHLIVVGEINDIAVARTIIGDGDDRVTSLALTLEVKQVLKSDIGDRDKVVVELPGMGVDPSDLESVRQELPEGLSLWFLRDPALGYQEDLEAGRTAKDGDEEMLEAYGDNKGVISTQGVFAQGEDHVVAPMAEHLGLDDMTADGETYGTLSELVDYVDGLG